MKRILDLDPAEIAQFVDRAGEPAFRARQIREWLLARGERDPARMTTLPRALRERLAAEFDVRPAGAEEAIEDADGTVKLLVRYPDGERVESVLIPDGARTTACLSSQAGCPVRCVFCASGMAGVRRSLSRGEIVEQFLLLGERARLAGRRITHVVVMGMGEPLLNAHETLAALRTLNDPAGPGLGARHMTLSTVGIEPGFRRLLDEPLQIELALSLHAADKRVRSAIVPYPGAMDPARLVEAGREWFRIRGREPTFEVVLLRGVNDDARAASALVDLLRGVRATVNVIPWNSVPGLPAGTPAEAAVRAFEARLAGGGIRLTRRRRRGSGIAAACGQLRLREIAGPEGLSAPSAAPRPPR